jgi:hypothetical protein
MDWRSPAGLYIRGKHDRCGLSCLTKMAHWIPCAEAWLPVPVSRAMAAMGAEGREDRRENAARSNLKGIFTFSLQYLC